LEAVAKNVDLLREKKWSYITASGGDEYQKRVVKGAPI
jgi:hypothetical protein